MNGQDRKRPAYVWREVGGRALELVCILGQPREPDADERELLRYVARLAEAGASSPGDPAEAMRAIEALLSASCGSQRAQRLSARLVSARHDITTS